MTNYKRTKGTLKEHKACNIGDCRSSDGLAVYIQDDGSEDGTCFSCHKWTANPYGDSESTSQQGIRVRQQSSLEPLGQSTYASSAYSAPMSLEEGLAHPVRSIDNRCIDHSTAEHFGVRMGVEPRDGVTPIYYLFPRHREGDQVGFKKVTPDKKISSTGGQEVDLFNLHNCKDGGKRIWITEGEWDAMSVYKALTVDSNIKWSPDVVSLPDGCLSVAKSIARNLDVLNKFDEVILVFDNDSAGKDAVKVACKMLAGKVSVVTLPLKDANEMLQANRIIDLKWQCLSHAKKYSPDGILNAKDMWLRYKDKAEQERLPYPPFMPGLNQKTCGAGFGSIVTITSGTGMGKTSFLRELMHYYATNTEEKIAGMFLEEDVCDTISGQLSLSLNKRITLPEVHVSEEEESEAFERLFSPGRISLYDFFGGMDDDSLLSKLKYFAVTGHRVIFLDHLSLVVSEFAAEGDERQRIDTLMTKLAKFVKEFNVVLFMVVHLRKTGNGKSFEEGERPSLDDLRGSGTLKQLSWDVIGLCRNQQHSDKATANTTETCVLKCRLTGRNGPADYLHYGDLTGRMTLVERPDDFFDSGTRGGGKGSNFGKGDY